MSAALPLTLLVTGGVGTVSREAKAAPIKVCSHNGTQNYNISGANAASLREKLSNTANFGPSGAYGDYQFEYVDVGNDFTESTILAKQCNIWFSGYEADSSYTSTELAELQKWVTNNNGQVIAGCDSDGNDPVCHLLGYSVVNDTDSYGLISDVAKNPLNCNRQLTKGSHLNMSGGAGAYFSGVSVVSETLAVHETGGQPDSTKPIVIYTGNYFFTSDINMIETGTPDDVTLSDGAGVINDNDILTMNAFSALADASVGNPVCSSAPPPPKSNSWGDVHMNTPDGLVYDFQAAGEFLFVESSDGKVRVQTRQEKLAQNPNVTLNTAVAMDVLGDRVGIYRTGAGDAQQAYLDVNGKDTVLAAGERMALPKGGFVHRLSDWSHGHLYLVQWPDGFVVSAKVILNSSIDVGVAKPEDSGVTYEGLVGNLNGNPKDDLQTKKGTLAAPASFEKLYAEFAPSWCVSSPGDSLFKRGPQVPCTYPGKAMRFEDLGDEERTLAETACKAVKNEILHDNCLLDVGVTGDTKLAAGAETLQEEWPEEVVRGELEEAAPADVPADAPADAPTVDSLVESLPGMCSCSESNNSSSNFPPFLALLAMGGLLVRRRRR